MEGRKRGGGGGRWKEEIDENKEERWHKGARLKQYIWNGSTCRLRGAEWLPCSAAQRQEEGKGGGKDGRVLNFYRRTSMGCVQRHLKMSRWALGDCYFIFFFALSDMLEKSNRSAKQRQQSGGLINVEGNEMEDTIPGDGEKVVGLSLGRYGAWNQKENVYWRFTGHLSPLRCIYLTPLVNHSLLLGRLLKLLHGQKFTKWERWEKPL